MGSPKRISRHSEPEIDTRRIAHWPDLTYHYGLSVADLRGMPNIVRKVYEQALPRLLASRQMQAIEAASFSDLKQEARDQVLARLKEHLPAAEPEVPVSEEGMQARGAAMGIGVQHVPPAAEREAQAAEGEK